MNVRIWRVMAVCAVIGLAAFLRFYRLDLIDLRFDQAYPLQYAQDIARGNFWGVQPHGSVAAHPVAYLYVIALPYLFTKNFVVVAAYRILLDVAAVGLCFYIGRRYFSFGVGLVSAGLFAVAPWAVQFARNFWPVPQPLFSALALLGLIELLQRKNKWGWAIAGWGMALVAGMHLGGIYLLPVAIVIYALCWRSFRFVPVALGVLPGLLVIGAYIAHDSAHQFENVRAYVNAVGGGSIFSLDAVRFSLWMSGGQGLSSLTGNSFLQWQAQGMGYLDGIDVLQVLLFSASVIGVGIYIVKNHKALLSQDAGGKNKALWIIFLWLVLPILLQLRSSRPVMLQYLPVLLPTPFLLVGVAANWVWHKTHPAKTSWRFWGGLLPVLLGLIGLWQMFSTIRFAGFVDNHATPSGYGLPIRGALAVRNAALASGLTDTVFVIKGFPTPWNEHAAILRSALADVPHRWLNSEDDGLVIMPSQTQFVFAPGTNDKLDQLLKLATNHNLQVLRFSSTADDALGYVYVRLNEPLRFEGFQSEPKPVWANRLELVRYHITQTQNKLQVETVLRVLDAPAENADFHYFNRVWAGEQQIAQLDAAGVHPSSWRKDDLVWMRFEVALPSNTLATQVRFGIYTYPQVQPVMVSIPGLPAEDGVTLKVTP